MPSPGASAVGRGCRSAADFAAAFKVSHESSGRRFVTDLKAAADAGMIDRLPHYNSFWLH